MRKWLWLAVLAAAAGAAVASSPLGFLVFDLRNASNGHLPDGWHLKVNRGTPDVSVLAEPEGKAVRLHSDKASFALERSVEVDPEQYAYITWKWKVSQLPAGGDFRHLSVDDQAAQVLVLFADRRVLTYIWDSTAPKGTMQSASNVPLVHICAVVCRSGYEEANRWLSESHNLVQDYQNAFHHAPPRIKGLRLQINSQHTGTTAESFFSDVAFRNTP